MSKKYNEFVNKMQKIQDVAKAISVLNWDQETYMPPKGAKHRSQQISTLSGISHELFTDKEMGDLLTELAQDNTLSAVEKKNVELTAKDYAKKKKLPTDFVVKLSDATSEAFHAWIEARKQDDFSVYIKPLEKMVAIQREKTEIYGYEEHPYNALMGDYEPGAKVSEIDTLFADVRAKLTPFIEKVFAAKKSDDSFMYKHFPKDKQWDFGMDMLSLLGYDIDAGRQDIAEHPFSTSFSPLDSRVTTRVDENNFYDMTWSCAHEAGHALYEQGMPVAQYGLPCGDAVSLGIHESQSRLYENNVARSMAFWQHNYGKLQTAFPANLQAVSLEDFYKGVNIVKPSLVRTDADELTYHFHIMIRYEIEKKLILGEIEVKDLPTIWNEAYKKYLKIDVPSDKVGVLQDVHWAHGGFGYFPTYSLGSFYAAQFFAKASEKIDNLEAKIAKGDMQPLLTWLRENIHQHGRFYTPQELCAKATGESLNFDYFMAYAEKKYGAIYGL